MKLTRRSGLLSFALVVVSAACGSSSKTSGTATTTATAVTTATAATAPTTTAATTASVTTASAAVTTRAAATTIGAATTAAAPATTVSGDPTAKLRIGQPAAPPQFNPHEGSSPTIDFSYTTLTYDTLIEFNSDLSLTPMLATKWTPSTDGLSLDLSLRAGVKFQDGTPFNADAVLANLNYVFNSKGTLGKSQMDQVYVTSVEKLDDATVRIRTSQAAPLLPMYLATYIEMGAMVSPAGLLDKEKLATGTVSYGSGPYRLKSVAQAGANYVRNDDYWDKKYLSTAPAEVEMIAYSDDNAKLNALRSGQIDAITLLTPVPTLKEMAAADKLQVYRVTQTAKLVAWHTNIQRAPLDNALVRQAISLAIDRQALSVLVGADDFVPEVQPFGPGFLGYVPGLKVSDYYDPDKARALLDKSGITKKTIELLVPTSQLHISVATAIQAMLKKELGLTVNITQAPTAQATADFGAGKWDSYLSNTSGQPDPQMTLADNFISRTAPGGPTPEMKVLYDKVASLPLGSAERLAALQAVSKYLVDNPQSFMLGVSLNAMVARSNVVGIEKNALLLRSAPIDARHLTIRPKS